MENSLMILSTSPLFANLCPEEIQHLLICLEVQTRTYGKRESILRAGETCTMLGIVLAGCVQIVHEDYWGKRDLTAHVATGGIFAEAYACRPGAKMAVSAVAEGETRVMWILAQRMLTACAATCPAHTQLIANLAAVLAEKSIRMNEKITHMAQRTTRRKLLSYLSAQAQRSGSAEFAIPFNRQQLADYLGVERSAMSAELSSMRREGLIAFEKNRFVLCGERAAE